MKHLFLLLLFTICFTSPNFAQDQEPICSAVAPSSSPVGDPPSLPLDITIDLTTVNQGPTSPPLDPTTINLTGVGQDPTSLPLDPTIINLTGTGQDITSASLDTIPNLTVGDLTPPPPPSSETTNLRPNYHGRRIRPGSNKYQRFPQVRLEGHRGAGHLEPENSLKAFQRAIDIGLDGVETDVWLSKDGVVFIDHGFADGTDIFQDVGRRKLIDLDSNDLENLTRLNGEKLVLLEDLLDLAKNKISINIELKDLREEIVAPVVDLLIQKDMLKQVFISSFNHSLRQTLTEEVARRCLRHPLNFGFIVDISNLTFPEYGVDTIPGDSININAQYLIRNETAAVAEMAEAAAYGVKTNYWFPWTYNTEELVYDKLLEVGTDTIITNKPLVLMDYLRMNQNDCPS